MRDNAGAIRAIGISRSEESGQLMNVTLFAVLTAMGAKVYIPHEPVPFTLQTLFVVLSGAFLGWRGGAMSMVLYLALGIWGLPVFAGPEAGLQIFFGPTAGYLFGFVISAAVVGAMTELGQSLPWTMLSMLTGFLLIFACGTFYLNEVFIHNWHSSLVQGFFIFSVWDLVKFVAAVAVYRARQSTSRVTPS